MDWKEKLDKVSRAFAMSFDTDLEEHLKAIHPIVQALSVPKGWKEVRAEESPRGFVFASRMFSGEGMNVIISVDEIRDKTSATQHWMHLSVSRGTRTPSYDELLLVRKLFIGEEKSAYQVFPPKSEHRNLHSYCLHLWVPLGDDPFPDVFGDRADRVAP